MMPTTFVYLLPAIPGFALVRLGRKGLFVFCSCCHTLSYGTRAFTLFLCHSQGFFILTPATPFSLLLIYLPTLLLTYERCYPHYLPRTCHPPEQTDRSLPFCRCCFAPVYSHTLVLVPSLEDTATPTVDIDHYLHTCARTLSLVPRAVYQT